ncbi:MAG: SDR family oxidoreductase [Blastocatellia bacterium]|nr:SDR family oxidoreductase [Blastocatellia bacterium]
MTKKYVVVGGSKGIGAALLRGLIAEGNDVISISRSVSDESSSATFIEYDVTSVEDFPDVEGSIDGVAYCPGSINLKPFHRLTQDEFMADLSVNFLGAVKTIQALLPNLKQSGSASIVLFSTVAVQTGMGFHASIAAAKGAVEGLTRSLAAEFAPSIRVNCIAPSLTDTPLASRLISTPEKREALAARNPLNKIGTADEVAAMAKFLLSGDSAWITGQILHVDGGMGSLK